MATATGAVQTGTRSKLSTAERIDIRLASKFNTRAIELAKQAHLDGTPRLLELRKHTILLEVTSRDRSHLYLVVVDQAAETCWCDCLAARHNQACCHVGAALLYASAVARACQGMMRYK